MYAGDVLSFIAKFFLPYIQFELSKCHLLVDLDLPVSSPLEPPYAQDTKTWKTVTKYPFLDPAKWVWLKY